MSNNRIPLMTLTNATLTERAPTGKYTEPTFHIPTTFNINGELYRAVFLHNDFENRQEATLPDGRKVLAPPEKTIALVKVKASVPKAVAPTVNTATMPKVKAPKAAKVAAPVSDSERIDRLELGIGQILKALGQQ